MNCQFYLLLLHRLAGFPLLKIFMTDENLGELSNRFDKKINIKRSAFKFTIKAIKTWKSGSTFAFRVLEIL